MSERFIEPSGETKEELIENLEMMLKDWENAVLYTIKRSTNIYGNRIFGFTFCIDIYNIRLIGENGYAGYYMWWWI